MITEAKLKRIDWAKDLLDDPAPKVVAELIAEVRTLRALLKRNDEMLEEIVDNAIVRTEYEQLRKDNKHALNGSE